MIKRIKFSVHDDDWLDFVDHRLPESAYESQDSALGIHWTDITVTDPKWIVYIELLGQEHWNWVIMEEYDEKN